MRGLRAGLGLVAAAAMLCGAAPAWASNPVVYVAGSGAAHSGTNTGNCQAETSPCATIAYALSQSGAGAIVAVAGTVAENGIAISQDATIEQDPFDAAHPPTIENSGSLQPLFVVSGGNVTFRNLTFLDGAAGNANGGAIADTSSGTVTVAGDTFSHDGADGDGGAIYVDNASGELDVSDSLFEFDSVGANTVTSVQGNGGAIADDGAALMTVRGSTFDTNATGGDGGGVFVGAAQTASIVGSTFVDNTSGGSSTPRTDNVAGNAIYTSGGTVNLAADLFDDTCAIGASDTVGAAADDGYNVALDESCIGSPAASDSVSPAAQDLYPLASNGSSSTQTRAVGAAGPAAGAIATGTTVPIGAWIGSAPNVSLCPVTDAAGVASNGSCNSGASQTTVARPVMYLAGAGAANVGGVTNTTSCGLSYASPCGLLEKALFSSLVNYPAYADPFIEVDGTVTETTSGITPTQPVTIQQDPGTQADPATAAVIAGNSSNELLTIGYDGVELKGLTFTAADPAIYDDDSTPSDTATIDGVTFTGNGTSSVDGGAIDLAGPATLDITGATFVNNTAGEGGSIFIGSGGIVHLASSSFSGDTATDGGAIAVGTAGSGTLYVDGSSFDGESATSRGGAIELAEGASDVGTAHIDASIFTNDSAAQWGGAISEGIYSGDGDLQVTDSIFGGDSAEAGGAIALGVYSGATGTPHAEISDSVFGGDWASANGGAIDNGDLGGSGVLTVAGSSFVGDYTTGSTTLGGDSSGGAIDNGDSDGAAAEASSGTLSLTGSTFYGDYVGSAASPTLAGPAVNEGGTGGDSATVAGDIFDGVSSGYPPPSGVATPLCGGTLTDGGYNAGTDASCYRSATGDQTASAALDGQLSFSLPMVSSVGSPATQLFTPLQLPVVQPLFSSPLVGLIRTSVGAPLCPATDILGVSGPYGAANGCSPGAIQSYVPVAPAANAYPTSITASSPNPGDASVSWTAPSLTAAGGEITGYTVAAHDVTTGVDGSPRTTTTTSLSFTGLHDGDTYSFRVTTDNSQGSSGPGTSNTVVIASPPPVTTTPTTTTPTSTTTPTPPTTPKPVVHTAVIGNQILKLTTPALSGGCLAPGKGWIVLLRSSAVAHSKKPKLRFVSAVLTLAGKHAKTVRRPSSRVSLSTTGLKAGSYTLKVVVSYRRGTKLVRKTLTAKLSLC